MTKTFFQPQPIAKSLRANARQLRRDLTQAERVLWGALNRAQLGVKFRRQHPFAPYILDFYCVEKHLAIELDGGQHNEAAHVAYDVGRSAFLEQQGVRVLRFWNNDVLANLAGVVDTVVQQLESFRDSSRGA